MMLKQNMINVYSALNPWIDFVIYIDNSTRVPEAEVIIERSFDDWFEEENSSETITEYISNALTVKNIKHSLYFKGGTENE